MVFAVKWCGMILLFCSCALYGFGKAFALRRRVKLLDSADAALEELAQRVQADGRERDVLLAETFGRRSLVQSGHPVLEHPDDRCILQTFLNEFGRGDQSTEYERIELCRALLRSCRADAQKQVDERARVYQVTGLCVGAAGCLFWL